MKNMLFIIPYFGKFNNYFQLFLNSCKYNENCTWLIITDDKTDYKYPKNVVVKYMSFMDFKKKVQDKFDFDISLETPYKICDYRPAYGYIFENYVKGFKYWGYCDTDLIFGNIEKILKDELINNKDKVCIFGHLTLYRNTKENNKIFMRELNGKKRYKEVFTTSKNQSFDEEFNNSINNIYLESNLTIMDGQYQANIYTKSSNFKLTHLDLDTMKYSVEKKSNSVFIYDNGNLYRYIKNDKEIKKEEYLYIHLQARKMDVKINFNLDYYKIIPNAFENIEVDNLELFDKIKKKNFNLHYFKLRSKNLIVKMKRKLKLA